MEKPGEILSAPGPPGNKILAFRKFAQRALHSAEMEGQVFQKNIGV